MWVLANPRQFVINMLRLKNPNVMVYLGAIAENNKDYEQTTVRARGLKLK